MFAAFAEPVVRLIALPAVASLIFAALVRWIGSDSAGARIAGAVPAVVFAWIAAFELGVPLYPPIADDNGLFYMIAAALVLGIAVDLWRAEDGGPVRPMEAALALAFGLGAVGWLRGAIDAWTAILVAGWMIVVLRIRFAANNDTPTAVAFLPLAGAGLAVLAWSAGLEGERDLALAFASASAGYFLFNWIVPSLPFGATLLVSGAGTLFILAVRLFETTQALAPALLILGFVFFADDPFRRILGRRLLRLAWAMPLFAAFASLLPLGLAALAAYIGVNFEAN
jgi:hypothetical protein